MPLLAPSLAPPIRNSFSNPGISSLHDFSSAAPKAAPESSPITAPPEPQVDAIQASKLLRSIKPSTAGKIPVVCLDVDVITDVMAARLATSLLGHVLFLKNQVPFPVMQLARIPGGQSNRRAAKMRNELLVSFDTLSSHLSTTFTALSTAFALSRSNFYPPSTNDGEKGELRSARSTGMGDKPVAKAYLALLLGPSIGSSKAKVIFAVDGLEVKVWGKREDQGTTGETDEEGSESDDEEDDSEEGEEDDDESDEDGEGEGPWSDEEASTEGDDLDANEPLSLGPPPSRSPSPPHYDPISSHSSVSPPSSLPLPPTYSYAEEQQAFRAADRLLSRTLASTFADEAGEGKGMACEMAPTQTHILLRAPRRFTHPAWIPRQNISGSLEGVLDEFLEESGVSIAREGQQKRRMKGTRTEGVWIVCRGDTGDDGRVNGAEADDEEDEMIWWSWDGKLIGFTDW